MPPGQIWPGDPAAAWASAARTPLQRRRPLPALATAKDFERSMAHPDENRIFAMIMGVVFVALLALAIVAFLVGGIPFPYSLVIAVTGAVALVLFPKMVYRTTWNRLHARAIAGAMLCDVYPSPLPLPGTGGAAILLDTRMPDQLAAHIHNAFVIWAERVASDPAAVAHIADMFGTAVVRGADELFGPQARGAFVAADRDASAGSWRLMLPEVAPADPVHPYRNGVLVTVNGPK
ncbi:hypothetical protein A5768_26075 [Mycolicibacterium fortuitum]|nr:hypothetical protein A5768_26075 [Mycolicibacterium fortuitum]